jgi:formyltetrahydrofolate-dependent phosphoribosylglycinamide formyltransferase
MPPVYPVTTPLDRPIRLGVLISGGGTTMSNLVDKIGAGELNAEISVVVANSLKCEGIERARERGLRCEVIARCAFDSVESFSVQVFDLLREADVDLVALAGFLALLDIPDDFLYRVMNIHPALIPAFCGKGLYGRKVHEAVIARGVKVSGCTVHFADNQYDHGPIIVQPTVPVEDGDTPDSLATRVFEAECAAYPEAIRLYAAGRVEVDGGRVRIR